MEIVVALAVGVLLASVVAIVTANLSNAAQVVDRQCRTARTEQMADRILASDLRGLLASLPQPSAEAESDGKSKGKEESDPLKDALLFEAKQMRFATLAAKTGDLTRPVIVHYQFAPRAGGGSLSRTERPVENEESAQAADSRITLLRNLAEGGFEYLAGDEWVQSLAKGQQPRAVRWRFEHAVSQEGIQERQRPPIVGIEVIGGSGEVGS